MKEREGGRWKIALFGHFDSTNLGNESTLMSILHHIRCFQPDAEITCISTGHQTTASTHKIEAIPISEMFFKFWLPRRRLLRLARMACIGVPSEFYRWINGFLALRHIDLFIIPGTGLLSDAYGLGSWGPYNMFKWSLLAKICGCKLLFLSVGAGPLYTTLGRFFVKSALRLADFRSYRDGSTIQYLKGIGFCSDNDRICPDLVFSFPEHFIPALPEKPNGRRVVALGVMIYTGKYSAAQPSVNIQQGYLDNLVIFVKWLLAHDYDVRLLIGDLVDLDATKEFRGLLRERLPGYDERRIIEEPISSVKTLLLQIAAADAVVATRFHNILLAVLCNKPVIAISFHHKCASLMIAMGLAEYCLDINAWKADTLIEKFCDLRADAVNLEARLRKTAKEFRAELDEQYKIVFSEL